MPRLNYVTQSPENVSVAYAEMPSGAEILFVNKTSGEKIRPSNSDALTKGGNGSADIAIPDHHSGDYFLLAQNGGEYLAQTVAFTLQ